MACLSLCVCLCLRVCVHACSANVSEVDPSVCASSGMCAVASLFLRSKRVGAGRKGVREKERSRGCVSE